MNGPPQITVRAIVLGALTVAANFYYIVNVGERLDIGSYVHSQFPMATFMPFVLWLFLNTALRALWPRVALSRGEMLTLFSMLWVVGTIPQLGWMTYWTSIVGAPSYFATAENQWEELFFDYLPWHVFANASPRVVDPFWFGLSEGASIPWDGWIGAIGQWLGVSMGMVVFGFCLIALFHKQWVEAEKLTFPLAQMPLDLTQGFEGKRWPELFCKPVFWIGFALVFLPILYNIATYFALGLPPIEFYWKFYDLNLTPDFFLTVRILPLIMAVTYLCPVDILGSMIFFHLLAALKIALMKRTGFSIGGFAVGAAGQQPEAQNIIYMESYGALVFIGLWSIWLARRHLRQVWHQVRTGQGEPRQVALYRLALAGLILSALSVIGWGVQLGMSLPVAIGGFLLMTLTYFVIAKLVAATGFAYLLPNKPHIKGDSFLIELVGSAFQSPRSLVAFKVFTSNAFFGTFRIPAWPALPHCFRLFSLERQPGRLTAMVLIAFPIGFVVLAVETISLAYEGRWPDFPRRQGQLDLRRYGLSAQQSHAARPEQVGGVVLRLWRSRAHRPAARLFPLVPPPSHRPGLPAHVRSPPLLVQSVHRVDCQNNPAALRRGQGLHRRQTPVLRSCHRLCGRSNFFYDSGSDLVPGGGTQHARMVMANHRKPT